MLVHHGMFETWAEQNTSNWSWRHKLEFLRISSLVLYIATPTNEILW